MHAAGEGIHWLTSYKDGLEEAKKLGKPVLLDFTAEWCGWCKKMEQETYSDTQIISHAKDFVCIKVDVDKDEETAFAYKVSGIPRTVLLNKFSEVIGDEKGFIDAMRLSKILDEAQRNAGKQTGGLVVTVAPRPASHAVQAVATLAAQKDNPATLVEYLGDKDPAVRNKASDLLAALGPKALPPLIVALSNEYLGTRIAAYRALQKMGRTDLDFDPWASKPEREESLRKWQAQLSTTATTSKAAEVKPPVAP